MQRTSYPSSRARRTTWRPRVPVPPTTRSVFLGTGVEPVVWAPPTVAGSAAADTDRRGAGEVIIAAVESARAGAGAVDAVAGRDEAPARRGAPRRAVAGAADEQRIVGGEECRVLCCAVCVCAYFV